MRLTIPWKLALPALLTLFVFMQEVNAMAETQTLDGRRQGIVKIAAFTASGDLDNLEKALGEGLDAGLTINQIKEVLTHLYAYTGFPRALNGMTLFGKVLQTRQEQGIQDTEGPAASPVPADLDRDAYGAQVRAELSGLKEVPPPAPWPT